jgi:hypothetical protein
MIKKLTIQELTAIKKNKIKDHFIEYEFTYHYIVEYLSKILEKYTNNGKLDLMSYFENIFLKNIDIWGFTMIYIVLYEHLYEYFNELNQYQMEFISKIKYIIIHFLYESPIEPIDVSSLVEELTSLNKVIEKFDKNVDSKRLEYNIEAGSKKKKNQRTYKLRTNINSKTKKRRK